MRKRERERESERVNSVKLFALRPLLVLLLLYCSVVHTHSRENVVKTAQKETKKSKQYTIRIVYVFCSSLGVTQWQKKNSEQKTDFSEERREIFRDC